MALDKPKYVKKTHLKNLVQYNEKYSDEDRSNFGRKGAEALNDSRRRRKAMREVARAMLETELCADDELRQELEDRGFRDYTEASAVLLAQLNRARAGDTEAAKFVRDTSGQRPADQVALGTFDDLPFEQLDLSSLPDSALLHLIEQRGGLDALEK